MAKALLICYHNSSTQPLSNQQVELLNERLLPDNISPSPPRVCRRTDVVASVFNPSEAIRIDGPSICLGRLVAPEADWAKPKSRVPDGSFALFRVNDEHVELVADAAATRTIWYAMTDELFIASSSQRAIVAVLGSFSPSDEARAWMLSSGALGPGQGWDRRVRRVPPGGRVLLDRRAWRVDAQEAHVEFVFQPAEVSDDDRRDQLEAIVDQAVGSLDVDFSRWIVPLSGGVDSRGLLLALQRSFPDRSAPRCVTWGQRAALRSPGNDAMVASQLAEHLGVEHEFFVVEASREPRERLINRFFTAGEGRIDAIAGYLDGFEVWRRLHDADLEGVIRGDEAFGWKTVRTEKDVRDSIRITTLQDYFPADEVAAFDLPTQAIPPALLRRPDESLAAWRDRLYQQFRLPVMLAALTDLKASYVEVLNPLLYSIVLAHVRTLPDDWRTEKKLWRDTVSTWSPKVPYARHGAVAPLRAFMTDPEMLELTLAELSSREAAGLFGRAALKPLLAELEASRKRRAIPRRGVSLEGFAARITRRLRRRAKRSVFGRLELEPLVLAFRALVATRMNALLRADAAAFTSPASKI